MITTKQMYELEEKSGIPKAALMENAGRKICQIIKEKVPDLKNKSILIVCYHGNNGGDGFVAARHLCGEAEVDVLFIGDEKKLKPEAGINYRKIKNNEMIQFVDEDDIDIDDYGIIIDAILGVGIKGRLHPIIAAMVDSINIAKGFKVAVDIPTGLNPDTGEIADKCVNADLIITMHDMKPGLEKLKEKVVVADIGMPKNL